MVNKFKFQNSYEGKQSAPPTLNFNILCTPRPVSYLHAIWAETLVGLGRAWREGDTQVGTRVIRARVSKTDNMY